MSEVRESIAARVVSRAKSSVTGRSRLIPIAPGREAPATRDRDGARLGMILLLAGGGLFWTAAGALAVYLLR